MAKFCQYCGSELNEEQEVCLKCGRTIKKEELKEKKENHRTYFMVSGIIGCILGLCLLCATTLNDGLYEMFLMCGILTILGGSFTLIGRNYKNSVLIATSASLYILSTIINVICISDISILAICSVLFAIFNFIYAKKV